MPFDATRCRVLLVGKMLAKLTPFLGARGYTSVVAEPSGAEAAALLGRESFDLVLLELNLRDIELRDFFRQARSRQADASFLLLAPPNEAESVVSALVLGADGYVPLPPDEKELMQVLARHGMAAMQRKNEDPDGQPGVAERVSALEEQLEATRTRHQAAEAAQGKLSVELKQAKEQLAKVEKELAETRKSPSVPAGHKVIELAKLEALEQRADFADFLESENDEVKKERDALRARLGTSLRDDAGGDGDFAESTGTFVLDDDTGEGTAASAGEDDGEEEIFLAEEEDAPATSAERSSPAVQPAKASAGPAAVAAMDDEDDDDFMGEMSEEIDLAAIEALARRTPDKPIPAASVMAPPFDTSELDLHAVTDEPAPEELSSEFDLSALERLATAKATSAPSTEDGLLDAPVPPFLEDDDSEDDFMGEMSEEIDLAAIEALAAKAAAAPTSPRKPSAPVASTPPVARAAPPPAVEVDDEDDFEDVKTEALLLMASELMTQGTASPSKTSSHADLESILAGLDDD